MRFNIYKEARLSLIILSIILSVSLIFYFLASMFTSMGFKGLRTGNQIEICSSVIIPTVIIDAGHGGEDPGAVSNELIEKELNLEISNLLNEIIISNGYKTFLTRNDDRLLYNNGEESRKKFYDIRNREKLANGVDNAVFISIHMNKFPASYCKGLQAFYYGGNNEGKLFAESIQNKVKSLQIDNKRIVANSKDTIYLLEKLKMPSTLVECGFISNAKEASLLKNSDYKKALALSIYCGVADYLEKK